MTFRFKHSDFGREHEGVKLTCVASGTGYFTEGKVYPIKWDDTLKCPYIKTDDGDTIRESSSLFTMPLPLTPKQPKVGEVWAIRSSAFTDNSLYWIDRVEAGLVYNRHILGGARHCEPVERFLEEHTFVF